MIQAELTSIDLWDEPDSKGRPRTLAEVTFREIGDGTELRMVWGESEARQAALALERHPSERPMTYDLTGSLLHALGARLASVEINRLENTIFYATLRVESEAGTVAVDARPSDAVNLALRARAPIHFARSVAAGAEAAGKRSHGYPARDESRPGRSALWPRHDSSS